MIPDGHCRWGRGAGRLLTDDRVAFRDLFHPRVVRVRIIGLGVDLADIDRVAGVFEKYPRFLERCFTEHEREYALRFAHPARRLAARFAGKEAVMKSMGTGWRRIRWTDIEITGGGKPTVRMSGRAAQRAEMLGVTEVMITITHTDTSALVMAVAVGEHG